MDPVSKSSAKRCLISAFMMHGSRALKMWYTWLVGHGLERLPAFLRAFDESLNRVLVDGERKHSEESKSQRKTVSSCR